MNELLSNAAEWHDELFISQPPSDAAEIRAATHEEVQMASGQAILALSVGPEIRSQRPESRSEIGLWQGEKFRPIEDGKRSRYNEARGIQEKVHTCPVEFPAMVAMGCTNDWPGVAMVVRARDRHRRFAGRVQGQSDR